MCKFKITSAQQNHGLTVVVGEGVRDGSDGVRHARRSRRYRPPPPPPPRRHRRRDSPTACFRETTLPPTSSLPPPPSPAHSHRAVHRSLSLQPARQQRPALRSQWLAETQWTAGRRQRLHPLTATTLTSPLSCAPLLPPT